MEVIKTSIEGLLIIEPKIFKDSRGYFFESFHMKEFKEKVADITFVQDNESCSTKGVMRGLHFQRSPFTQAKLVRCVRGIVLDVNVDLRKDSPTFGKYEAIELTEDNHRELFIPKGFAHGFAVLSDIAVFQYKCDNYYCPDSEDGVNLFDSDLNIQWHFPHNEAILSKKDLRLPSFKDFEGFIE